MAQTVSLSVSILIERWSSRRSGFPQELSLNQGGYSPITGEIHKAADRFSRVALSWNETTPEPFNIDITPLLQRAHLMINYDLPWNPNRLEQRFGRIHRISYVPAVIRDRAKELGTPLPVLRQYERVCFEKSLISVPGRPLAQFICPGHPLLDTLIELVLDKHRQALRTGAVLVDTTDAGRAPRVLFFLEQAVRDAGQRLISREVHFIEIEENSQFRAGGSAPYLDYRPARAEEIALVRSGRFSDSDTAEAVTTNFNLNLDGEVLENRVVGHAIEKLVPRHLERVRQRREELIDKTAAAVQERLTKEINYWDRRAAELRQQEQAGQPHRSLNAKLAQQRADELAARLARRQEELALERQISATPPVVVGGALVVPVGLLLNLTGLRDLSGLDDVRQRQITKAIAMKAVIEAEIALGNDPSDVSKDNLGYDIESLDPRHGRLRFIEVKGRRAGAETVTVTRNEILTAVNAAEPFILAIVEVEDGRAKPPRYVRRPFSQEPDLAVTSVNVSLAELLVQSNNPRESR